MWGLLCFAVCGVAGGRPGPAPAAIDLSDLGAPSFTSFGPRDGLPHAVLVDVLTDREGFVWAASPNGLYRYDGRLWSAPEDPVMRRAVDSLWLDRDGVLWAALRDAGVAHLQAGRWQVEDLSTGMPSQQVRRLQETLDAQGRWQLHALTWDRGVMTRRQGRWQADADNASLPPGPVLSMAQTRQLGAPLRQWLGTGSEGLWYRDAGTTGWQRMHIEGIDVAQIEFLHVTGEGEHEALWISAFGVGLLKLDARGLQRWQAGPGALPTNDLYDLASTPSTDADPVLWVSTRAGLVRLHGEHLEVFDRRHGLPANAVRGLQVWTSPAGNPVLWLATESGIARTVLDASAWSTASLMGARSTGVFAALVEPDGHGGERLWVGASEDGLALYQGHRWQRFTAQSGALPFPSVSLLKFTQDGAGHRQRWLGLGNGDLLRIHDGPRLAREATPWPREPGNSVLDVLVRQAEGQEERWVGTRQSGLYRWRNGQWTQIQLEGIQGQWRIDQLLNQRDAQGHDWLWVTTNQGLLRFDGQHWQVLGRESGLPDSNLLGATLLDDAAGRPVLWLGSTSVGAIRMDVTDPAHPHVLGDRLPPAPDSTVYSALRDSRGRIYLCTNNGVQRLTPQGAGYRSQVFTRREGMLHDECNTHGQSIDAQDRYWVGTLGGLTVYDPRHETLPTEPKPLRLTARWIDGQRVPGTTLQVPAGAREVDVDYALLSWDRESESRFRSQLIGAEDQPGPWTAQSRRSFSNLPAGRYRLRVEARDHAGTPSTPLEVDIHVQGHWWQHPWIWGMAAVGLVLAGYGLSLLRTRHLRARQAELEAHVIERTTALAAANQRLVELSYVDSLTGLANRRQLMELLEAQPRQSSPRSLALILMDVDHFKALNDAHGHLAGDQALRHLAATLRHCADDQALVARYGGEEFACVLQDANLGQALAMAERIRAGVAASRFAFPGETAPVCVTISAGVAVAVLARQEDVDALLRCADEALYQAKHEGRNRVRAQVMPAAAGAASPGPVAAAPEPDGR